MSQYAHVALIAYHLVADSSMTPRDAWDPAVDPAQANNASDATGSNPFMINKASAPKVDGEIKVSFVNLPPGMRVMETRSSGFDVSHDVGYTRFGR